MAKKIFLETGNANEIKSAFYLIQKLYTESSSLIKEIEGQLRENKHRFQILINGAHGVIALTSLELEPRFGVTWLLRKFSVAFVEESSTGFEKVLYRTHTEIYKELKVLYFKFILDDINQSEPQLIFGVFYDIKQNKDWVRTFESLLRTLEYEYVDNVMFAKLPNVDYEDENFKIKGIFKKVNLLDLLDIKSTDKLLEKVINPVIQIYEQL